MRTYGKNRISQVVLALAAMMVGTMSWGGYVDDDFTGANGTLLSTLSQWSSPSDVIISNNQAYLPSSSAATNTVGVSPTIAWTDFDITPALGAEPTSPATNTSSALFYFNADGYIVVWTNDAWTVCTNDVWGNTVTALTPGASAGISIYQNYTDNEFALFLNEKLLIQDAPFPSGSTSAYSAFAVDNVDSNALVDDVWIQATYVAGPTVDSNGNTTKDIVELHDNGYAARTLYVPGTGSQPKFATIQAAVDAARDGDTINVAAGTYAETVAVTAHTDLTTITFVGGVFTTTTFTVTGVTVTFDEAIETGTFTANAAVTFNGNVDATTLFTANAAVTFNGDVETATFVANASVTLAGGADLNASTLLDINSTATLVGTSGTAITTPDLDMVAGTEVDVTSGSLSGMGITMDGTFTIDGGNWDDWGGSGVVAQSLPFSDNFDSYGNDTAISGYGFNGWNASSTDVKVQSTIAQSGKALILPDGTAASNLISDASSGVWTQYDLRPMVGAAPSSASTTGKSFMSYVDTNGYMCVYESGGWVTCSQTLGTTPHAPALLSTNSWRGIAIYQHFGSDEFALFVEDAGGNLEIVKQQVDFPGGDLASYTSFIIENQDSNAYLDNVSISTVTPSNSDDLDGDGIDDTLEVTLKGFIYDAEGTIFKFM